MGTGGPWAMNMEVTSMGGMTTITARTIMTTPMTSSGLLTLTQWLSPAFPLGAFAYSHGLETAVSEGRVRDAEGLSKWLDGVLRFGAGRTDAILLAQCLTGGDAEDLAALAQALSPTAERLAETFEQGKAFARTVRDLGGFAVPDAALPVAFGVAARQVDCPPDQVVALYLHSFMSNLVSAGVRFIPLGQTDGQRVLAALHPVITSVAAFALQADLDDLSTAAFASDIDAGRHEALEVRIFKS